MHEYVWQRSSFCGGGGNNCIEVAANGDVIAMRESSEPDVLITANRDTLRAFVLGLKAGRLDVPRG
ncbi:DUF397 domain-containing protein [Streptomyces sp. NPDC020845]|uniref:DUF397 domain-containing protein n=1 Tax=Streptomyces sp. NPDC020845 TaxID=3365096 RepID=UPI003794ED8C